MGGLAISIMPLSKLENLQTIGAEYYLPDYVAKQDRVRSCGAPIKTLADISKLITDGDHGIADYVDEGVKFVLSANVKQGWIDTHDMRSISVVHHASLGRSSLKEGDILVTKTGVYFGNSAVVPHGFGDANTIAHVGIIRLKEAYDPTYVSTFLNSTFGYSQLRRRGMKATRPEIKLIEFNEIEVPFFSEKLNCGIAKLLDLADKQRALSAEHVDRSALSLLKALGLANWAPPEPLSYSASSVDAFASGRLDAQFFAPRIQQLIDHLSGAGTTIGTVATPRREKFDAAKHGDFDYIEIGDLDGTGASGSSRVPAGEAPSRATWFVRPGDIITSTVRPIRRLSAQISPDQDGYVCSSGFVVLDPTGVQPELLLTYLRLPVICELMDLFASASMYPAISEADILALPFPAVDTATEQAVVSAVQEGRAARARARTLLDASKRAVEIAIEESEAAALAYLDKIGAA